MSIKHVIEKSSPLTLGVFMLDDLIRVTRDAEKFNNSSFAPEACRQLLKNSNAVYRKLIEQSTGLTWEEIKREYEK